VRFLVVEDDPDVARLVKTCLRMRWGNADVETCVNERDTLELLGAAPTDLIVLDLGLPTADGIDILSKVRETTNVPVIILTVQDDEARKVVGLEAGADDYILKPFNYAEFLARVNAVLRRSTPEYRNGADDATGWPGVNIDFRAHRAARDNEEVRLTPMEWAVLAYLHRRRGEVVSVRDLSETIWETSAPQTAAIKTIIRRLRLKLEHDPADPQVITSARGFGYRFDVSH